VDAMLAPDPVPIVINSDIGEPQTRILFPERVQSSLFIGRIGIADFKIQPFAISALLWINGDRGST
jgi:hypothetical protein